MSSKDSPPPVSPDILLLETRSRLYPIQAWYCIGIFIFIIAIFQWFSFFYSKFARRRRNPENFDLEQVHLHRRRGFSWRRLPLGFINTYRAVVFRCTLEIGKSYSLTMAEVLTTVAYFTLLFIWEFINTTDLEGNKLSLIYWCSRAGTLATSQFPLITALGTKNNIVSLITGISYDKLNYVHRMTSRVVFILLCVHAGGEAVEIVPFHLHLNSEPWLISGIIATVAFTILCIISLRPIRAKAYELFFYVHFAMVLTFLVCAYFHTKFTNFSYWIYPCFIIWGLDRLIRVIQFLLFNSEHMMNATTELLSDDLVRLKFRRPPYFKWAPGQTAYLMIPSVSRLPFEAHPFTIASFGFNHSGVPEMEGGQSQNPTQISREQSRDSSAPLLGEVVFLINVRKGFTARLKEAAVNGNKVGVFMDGPYGYSPKLGSYDTSVLIAGGSGVSYTLPFLLDVIERVRHGKSSCRRIVFIWLIRNSAHIHWVGETLIRALHHAPRSLSISVRIHVTAARTDTQALPRSYSQNDNTEAVNRDSSSEFEGTEKTKDSLLAVEGVQLEHGRCDLPSVLRDEVEVATGRMSVCVCGSQAIARSVRGALRFPVSSAFNVANGGPSITLHVESFGYA